jgi:hypothetical protein
VEAGRPAAREKNATHLSPFFLTFSGSEAYWNSPRCSLGAKPIECAVVSQFDALTITAAGAEPAFWGLWALLVSSRLAASSIALLGAFSMTAARLCPRCGATEPLGETEIVWPKGWVCSSCGYAVPVSDGVPMFASELANAETY